jgi:hypothetical protein
MKFPRAIWGTRQEVLKRSRSVVGEVARGSSLSDCVWRDGAVDSEQVEGFVLLDRMPPLQDRANHFRAFELQMLLYEGLLNGGIEREREESLFNELIAEPWSSLGMLSMVSGAQWTMRFPNRCRKLCDVTTKNWADYLSLGSRYAPAAVVVGKQIYEVPCFLGPLLVFCGVPKEQGSRLFTEGLAPLLKYVQRQ